MNRCDIVLINPNYQSDVFQVNVHIPCGLGFITRALEINNYSYKIVDWCCSGAWSRLLFEGYQSG